MAIASKVQDYMTRHGLRYDVLTHLHSHNSMETAELSHIPGRCLAKSVVLQDDSGRFLMAVLPTSHHIELDRLGKALNCRLHLASEEQVARLFDDCEFGAIPPVGSAYGMQMIVDESLAEEEEIYFEAGDHEQLIQMSREDFMSMMEGASHARFGEPRWHH